MEIAYYINNNGEKIEISAQDIKCKRYIDRFFCPYCGEQVNWINGKIQEKHFRHHHSSYSQDCENYSTSISINKYVQPYERDGLPLYLIKEFGTYSLAIGLYGLMESTIKEAEEIKLEIEIDMGMNTIISIEVNVQYFIPHKMNFIKISEIKQQYSLRFSQKNIPLEIRKKWIPNINGIGTNGAIFSIGDFGGKKVSSLVGLIVNQEYLLLTSYNIDINHINGIFFELHQEISLGWLKKYKLYKFIIKEINRETISFCDKFDMDLQYFQPEIIPIWPPCTILEQELIYKDDSNKYFVLTTDNEKEKNVYSHKLKQKMPSYKITNNKYIVSSSVKSDDFITITNSQNQFTISLINQSWINNEAEIPNIKIETKADIIMITANVKVFVNHFKNDILLNSNIIKDGSSKYIKINKNESIVVLYGLDIIMSMQELLKRENPDDVNILDKKLLENINKCNGELVFLPDNFKWMVLKQKKFHLSYRELQKQMKNGDVSIKLINLLKNN